MNHDPFDMSFWGRDMGAKCKPFDPQQFMSDFTVVNFAMDTFERGKVWRTQVKPRATDRLRQDPRGISQYVCKLLGAKRSFVGSAVTLD